MQEAGRITAQVGVHSIGLDVFGFSICPLTTGDPLIYSDLYLSGF